MGFGREPVGGLGCGPSERRWKRRTRKRRRRRGGPLRCIHNAETRYVCVPLNIPCVFLDTRCSVCLQESAQRIPSTKFSYSSYVRVGPNLPLAPLSPLPPIAGDSITKLWENFFDFRVCQFQRTMLFPPSCAFHHFKEPTNVLPFVILY